MGQTKFNARLGLSVGTTPIDVIDSAGAVSIPASQGITLGDGAPGVTTDKLYQIGSNLYWNGSTVGSGGGSLPAQSGNAGKFLITDGTNTSWSNAISKSSAVAFLQSTRSDLSNTISLIHSAANLWSLNAQLEVANDPTTALQVSTKQYTDNSVLSVQPAAIAAAIGPWQTYTPTWAGVTTNPSIGNGTLSAKYRRVGDSIELIINVQGGSTTTYGSGIWSFSLPPGLSLTTNLSNNYLGHGTCIDSGWTQEIHGYVCPRSSTSIGVIVNDAWVSNSAPFTWGTTALFQLKATIPIDQWTSNINLIKDFTEYLSCDGTGTGEGTAANTSYTPANPYRGQDGSLIPAVTISSTTATTSTAYALISANPPKSTDKYFLEYSANGGVSWNAIEHGSNTIAPAVNMNGVMVGMRLSVTTTGCTVSFSNAGRITGTTYGSGQGDWATVRATPYFWRWRVRKVSNGNFAQGSCAFSKTIGDGSSTTLDVTHGLQTEDVIVFVREASGLKREIDCTKRVIDSMTVRLTDFITAPAANSLQIFVGTNGGTTGVTSDVQNFAYNTSTSTTSDTTSFGYGPDGCNFTAMAPTGLNGIEKRVRFQSVIKSTDCFILELYSNGAWTDFALSGLSRTFNDAGTTAYGAAIGAVSGSGTDMSIVFYSGPQPGAAWSSYSALKWRVRKISNGNFSQLATDSYSTSEVATNKTWINGKTIYRKVVDLGTLPNSTSKAVAHNISGLDTFISISGMSVDASNLYCPLPYPNPSDADNVYLYANTTNVVVGSGIDMTGRTGFAILEYTK